jgi:hypothetical protein
MTRIKLVDSPRDLGSNAALCLLKGRIGESKSSDTGVNLQDTNVNDNHKPDPSIPLMRVS